MMRPTSPKNTLWRDLYGRAWRWGLGAAVVFHAVLFLFLPRQISDRLHEALIPSPTVFVRAGGPGTELEVVALRSPPPEVPQETPPPPPEPVEEAVIPTPAEVPVEETVAAVTEPTTETEGTSEDVAGSEGEAGAPAAGGGTVSPPRPLHLVVPRLPGGVDKRRARGQSVHLLVEVLPDGTVGEVRIEKGSRMPALDLAALDAARQMRYVPATRGGEGIAQWTRAEMRF